MNIKNTAALAILAVALSATSANAQFYIRAGIGYAMPAAGQNMDGNGLGYSGGAATATTYNLKNVSFSAGVQGVLGLGYMFSKNVGVQLDANAGIAPRQYSYSVNNTNVGGIQSDVEIKSQAAHLSLLMPSLVLQSGGDEWNIYCRLGIVLPLNTTINQDQYITNVPGTGATTVEDYGLKLSNSFSLGYTAGAGVSYKLSDRVSVWGELNILSLSAYIKEQYFDSYSVNGQSVNLANYNIVRSTYYSKSGTIDSVHAPTYSQPFSNVGFTVGIKFNLSDREPREHKSSGKRERGYYE